MKVTSIIKGKISDENYISGNGIIDGTTVSSLDESNYDSVVRVTGGCGYYKMSVNQKHTGVERKLQAYSYRREMSWHKLQLYRPIKIYKLNDAVEVLTTSGRYSRDPLLFSANLEKRIWLTGVVTKVRRDNVYDVAFTNLREEEGVMAVNMRTVQAPVYSVDEMVHIRSEVKRQGRLLLAGSINNAATVEDGKIVKANYDNTYDIQYAQNGRVEKNVSWYKIAKLSASETAVTAAANESTLKSKSLKKIFSESEDCQVLMPVVTSLNNVDKKKEANEWVDGVVVKRRSATSCSDRRSDDNSANKRLESDCEYAYDVRLLSTGDIVKVPDKGGAIAIRESLLVFSFSDLLKIS